MSIYLSKTSDLENFFKDLGIDLVFSTKNDEELRAAVETSIQALDEFQALPSFRQYGILQFIEGVSRGTARLVGAEGAGKFKPPSPRAPRKTEDIPRAIKALQPGASWRKHLNGGGWVSSTAYVEASVHVGPKAVVYENARVTERARIYGAAVVRGDAECYGACHVHGLAIVEGHARVCDAARVLGKVRLTGSAIVAEKTLVRGDVVLDGSEEEEEPNERVERTRTRTASTGEASRA